MPRPSQAAKDAAFRNQDRATLVAISSGPAAAGAALIPVVGPFVGLGIAGVGAAFGIRALKQGRIAHDPPRDDYTTSTTLPEPSFDVTSFGQSPLEISAAELIRANDSAAGALEAMIVALERGSGAELAGDGAMTEARVAEAYDFARLASQALRESSERAGPFRVALDAIGPDVVAGLDASGVPSMYLSPVAGTAAPDPISVLSSAIGQSAESDYEFALALERLADNQTLLEAGTS